MKIKNLQLLCPTCKTEQNTYLLDNRNPFCTYLDFNNGKTYITYKPIEKRIRQNKVLGLNKNLNTFYRSERRKILYGSF